MVDVDDVVEKRSRFFTKQVDSAKPSWFDGRYRKNEIEDQVSYLQWEQPTMYEFWEFQLSEAQPSSWINWPTPENPSSRYKYVSGEFNLSLDKMNWTR